MKTSHNYFITINKIIIDAKVRNVIMELMEVIEMTKNFFPPYNPYELQLPEQN